MYLGTAKNVIQIRWKNQKQVLKKCMKIIKMVKLKLWARALTQNNIWVLASIK